MFDLGKYRESEISPKLRYFFEYLDMIQIENNMFNNDFFESLNEDDFLYALQYYIEQASPARQTAQDYIRDVKKFFEMLYEDYGIRNSVFYNNEILSKFEKSKSEIISKLREQENKDCISDEEFEKLNFEIAKFLNIPNLENIILQDIEKYYSGIGKKPKLYTRFVSVIPTMLAMKYALKNNAMVKIRINDLDLQNGILKINSFHLPLSKVLIDLLVSYCKMRELIIERSQSKLDFLFLKVDGISYISQKDVPDYATFFCLMDESIGTSACQRLSYKRIIELADKGAGINVLAQLATVPPETIRTLCNIDNDSAKAALVSMITEQHTEETRKEVIPKGTMKCVYCGKIHSAESKNWLLIQLEDSKCKYLACRECRGKDGKYRY